MIKDTISTKRGKNRLRKHADRIVTDTLSLLKELLRIAEDSKNKEDIYRAYQAHIELIPYIRPKLQAIAPAEMDGEGGLTALQVRRYADVLEEAKQSYADELKHYLPQSIDDPPWLTEQDITNDARHDEAVIP